MVLNCLLNHIWHQIIWQFFIKIHTNHRLSKSIRLNATTKFSKKKINAQHTNLSSNEHHTSVSIIQWHQCPNRNIHTAILRTVHITKTNCNGFSFMSLVGANYNLQFLDSIVLQFLHELRDKTENTLCFK